MGLTGFLDKLFKHSKGSEHPIPNVYRVFSPIQTSNSPTPARCAIIQLNSGTFYPEIVSDPTRLRPQAYKTVCTPFRCQLQVQVVTCASDQLTIDGRFQWPPSLGWINVLKWLTELRETKFYLLDHHFIIKEYTSRTARWKRGTEQGVRKGCRASMPPSGTALSPHLHVFTSLGALWTPSFWGFMEVSLHRHDWSNHWPSVINFQSLSSSWRSGVGCSNFVITWLVPIVISIP